MSVDYPVYVSVFEDAPKHHKIAGYIEVDGEIVKLSNETDLIDLCNRIGLNRVKHYESIEDIHTIVEQYIQATLNHSSRAKTLFGQSGKRIWSISVVNTYTDKECIVLESNDDRLPQSSFRIADYKDSDKTLSDLVDKITKSLSILLYFKCSGIDGVLF